MCTVSCLFCVLDQLFSVCTLSCMFCVSDQLFSVCTISCLFCVSYQLFSVCTISSVFHTSYSLGVLSACLLCVSDQLFPNVSVFPALGNHDSDPPDIFYDYANKTSQNGTQVGALIDKKYF
jgi:hypothetical protein